MSSHATDLSVYAKSSSSSSSSSPPPVGAQVPRVQPSRRNITVLNHAKYVPTMTTAAALRIKVAQSKAAW